MVAVKPKEPPMTHYVEEPGPRMVRLYGETEPLFQTLAARVAPHATRRPDQAASPGIVADARHLLRACARLVARQSGWRGRLALAEAPSWAELDAKLGFGAAALAWFYQRHLYVDEFEFEADPDAESEE